MSDAGLQVLDGAQLAAVSPPDFNTAATIAVNGVFEVAEARASECLYGVSLPENLKASALKRLNFEFKGDHELDLQQAEKLFRDYISAIADELKDDPLVVSVLDGNTIRLYMEDEDDFAMLAENLFTELDVEDEGKLSKREIQSALVQMGVEMGVPSISDLPVINDILKNHGAEGEEKLGQAQFAQLLQPILQVIADALALKHNTVIHNVKIANGSLLRKLLEDKKQLDDIIEVIYLRNESGKSCTETIRRYLEKNGKELGLPPLEGNEAVTLLYDAIFSVIGIEKNAVELEKSVFGDLVKKILQKFVVELQANPVFHDADK